TTFTNPDSEALPIYLAEYLSGSGQVEFFQPYAGFGEPFFTPSCPDQTYLACSEREDGLCDQCNFVAYSGVDAATGVSYGLIHGEQRSSSLSTVGINLLVYGEAVFNVILGLAGPNYTVPGQGELTLTRYFAVGDGTVGSIAAVRNDLFGIDTVEISGMISSAGEPLSGAQVAVYQVLDDRTNPPQLFLVSHARTNEEGEYILSLPPGEYEMQTNMEGYLFPDDGPRALVVEAGSTQVQDFSLPEPGYLEVTLIDEVGPGPGKLQLVGFDPSPPLSNTVSGNEAGIFGDIGADRLPFGIAQAAYIDRNGASQRMAMEPGEYQLVLSRGPRYSVFKQDITITAGQVTTVQGEIAKVVDDTGFIHGDFHVHSIDSPDSEVTREERVAVMLAEGMDFFTPSDHGFRADFAPTLEAMGVSDLISTASSSETTTFDYGHFNSWPTTVDPTNISGGSFDWAGEAPVGMDFPEYGNYNRSPAQIIGGLKEDPMDNLVQINHIYSHFGAEGLAIDTGQTPPQSQVDLSIRRLDPTLENAFDSGFDALEVWIGDGGRGSILSSFLGENAGDWFNLMNQDLVRVGIANSDTHDRRFSRVSARTLIASDTQDPGQLASEAETLAATVLAGKA
ncbi:MAG: carboxypeptidase regulatory-like domain-containing protein, partial [Halieaceae bacterium]